MTATDPSQNDSENKVADDEPSLSGTYSSRCWWSINIPPKRPPKKGRFEWTIVGKTCVPCILKTDGTKYVSVRIAESKVLGHFFQRLNAEVFNCTSVKSFSITDAETKLLNEINTRHCEFAFGKNPFTMNTDFIVKLDDLIEFYHFINTCYNKLLHTPQNGANKCGFVRINDDSVVPYAVRDNHRYVPLFYFEGETESLKLKAINLENWDLAYLKFCCKVQGIKNELFASEQCMVTSLDDVKSYFPEGTKFEEYWPTKLLDMQSPAKSDVNGNHSWVQTPHMQNPSIPQAVPITAHANAILNKNVPVLPKQIHSNQRINATAVINNANSNVPLYQSTTTGTWPASTLIGNSNVTQSGTYQLAPSMQGRVIQKPSTTNNIHSLNANNSMASRSYTGQTVRSHTPQYYAAPANVPTVSSTTQPPPPPLVRLAPANAMPNSYTGDTYSQHMFANLPTLSPMGMPSHQLGSTNATAAANRIRQTVPNHVNSGQSINRFPPVLTPINGMNNTVSSVNAASNIVPNRVPQRTGFHANQNGGSEIIDLSSPPHSPHSTTNGAPSAGAMKPIPAINNLGYSKPSSSLKLSSLTCVPEVSQHVNGNSMPPFEVKSIQFKDKSVLTMNLKPYVYQDYVIALPNVISNYFPRVSPSQMRHVLQNVFKIELYRGNSLQMQILKDHKLCKQVDEEIPLIQLKDLENVHRQLEYLEPTMHGEHAESDAKRPRLS